MNCLINVVFAPHLFTITEFLTSFIIICIVVKYYYLIKSNVNNTVTQID